jgi:hypothetical protein
MVRLELGEIFDIISLARSAPYETMMHSNSSNDPLCELKLDDLEKQLKEVSQKIKELHQKIEFMKG